MGLAIPGLDEAPTKHAKLLAWVREVAELTQPDRVVWADGSDAEWDRLTAEMVAAGTFTKLNDAKKPNSFLALSDPADVARTGVFLAENASITGITVAVDKGQHLVPLARDIMFVAEQLGPGAAGATP